MQGTDFISKSRRKRDMHALQDVGERLIALSDENLRHLGLPEALLEAVLAAKRISPSKHTALKRQRQYIGRVMRDVDAAPIIEQINALKAPTRRQNALLHLAEEWREKVIRDGSAAGLFVQAFPCTEVARLHDLAAAAREELDRALPRRHFRDLYHFILAAITDSAGEIP